MRRRDALLALLAAGAAVPRPAGAQQPARTYRVGLFVGGTATAVARQRAAVVERLATHGIVEGRNLQVLVRIGSFNRATDAEVAQALVAAKLDAILVDTSPLAVRLREATRTIPLVFAGVADPIGAGLVRTFAKPGGNATGTYISQLEISAKRLELLRELLPDARHVWVPRNTAGPDYDVLPHLHDVGKRLAFRLTEVTAAPSQPFPAATWASAYDKPDAIVTVQRWVAFGLDALAGQIVEFAIAQRIPSMFWEAEMAARGATIAYGVDPGKELARATDQLARVLKGASPASLPVDQATEYELVISRKSVKALGITIPSAILARARVVD
ncbi:MAG: ABC transporter substrate-binding protein [Betaproteobacteria bacterium]|nr:ABC transporter substrate-binding protein [Betaproteobacteria bacterium]